MKYKSLKKRLAAAFLTTCLITGNLGTFQLTAYGEEGSSTDVADAVSSSDRDVQEDISRMLSSDDYIDGRVIALYDTESSCSPDEELVGASALLDRAELITGVSPESYVNATGETLDIPDEDLVGASENDDDRLALVTIEDSSKTTEELLTELLSDPRVLLAEPDYTIEGDSLEESDLTVPEDESTITDPSNGSTLTVPEDTSTLTVPEDTLTLTVPEDDSTLTVPEDESTPAVPEEQADLSISEIAANPETLSEETASVSGPIIDYSVSEEEVPETVVGASGDLTPYQWGMSDGSNRYTETAISNNNVYGMNIPNWNVPGTENSEGVVAVIDSGVDYNHPDLRNNMYVFSSAEQEALGCGPYGVNFVTTEGEGTDPMDRNGHGTHCAGIIGASWDNSGVSGVTSGSKIMAIRILDAANHGSYTSILNGLAFVKKARKLGIDIRVANNSYGGTEFYYIRRVLVEELGEMGIVCAFSSGNEATYIDPASRSSAYLDDLPNVVVVNASDVNGDKADFSNYSQNATHIFAPGVDILSTIPLEKMKETPRSYFTELDASPIYSNPSWNISMSDLFAPIPYEWITDSYWEYFHVTQMKDMSSNGSTPCLRLELLRDIPDISFTFCLDLPISSSAEIGYISADFLVPDSNVVCRLRVIGKDSAGKSEAIVSAVADSRNDWSGRTITDLAGYDCRYEENGKTTVPVYVDLLPVNGSSLKKGDSFYIDNIAIGSTDYDNTSAPYGFMGGTSMAAPAAAGAAMILYKGRTVNAENAALVTASLKSMVRKKDSLTDYCTSGGVLNLSVTGEQKLPVISSADISGTDRSITLKGYFFGTQGDGCAVSLADTNLDIISWNDNTIKVKCPDKMRSGLQKISVTTASGSSARGAFSLTVPESSNITDLATPLYETELPKIPSDLMGPDEMILEAKGLNNYIYLAICSAASPSLSTDKFIRYNIKDKTYETIAEPPFGGLADYSIAAYRGTIFVSGRDKNDIARLVYYQPSTNKWLSMTDAGQYGSSLVNFNDHLFYIGGYDLNYSAKIREINVYNGSIKDICTLPDHYGGMNATVLNNSLFLYGGAIYDKETDSFSKQSNDLICYTLKDSTLVRDTSQEVSLKDFQAKGYEQKIGTLCASDKDLFMVGFYSKADGSDSMTDPSGFVLADGDTWKITDKPENYGKRLSHTIVNLSVPCIYKGVLYGFAQNTLDGVPTEYVARSTVVDSKPETPVQDTITVSIPKAAQGLVYNGKAQTGVPYSEEGYYTITDNEKTAAGTYKATLTLNDTDYYVWEDGTTAPKTITWTIAKKTVNVKSVKLNKTSLTIYVGNTAQLKATISPSNADNKNVTWKSANAKIAKVDKNGKVTGVKAGTVKITVTTKEGSKKAVCTVKVLKGKPVYRLYNRKGNGDHLFTISSSEKAACQLRGWKYEGIAWYVPEKSGKPVYRLYNPNNGLHMYTCASTERTAMVSAGWKLEGIAFYASTGSTGKSVYRLYNPNGGQHFFTTSASERDMLKKAGWRYEGTPFKVL